MTYFSKFPKQITRLTGKQMIVMTDLFRRIKAGNRFVDLSVALVPYIILDGETPDLVSNKFYGTPFYHWVLLFVNNITNVAKEWPISNAQVIALTEERYDTGLNGIHHYIDTSTGLETEYGLNNPFLVPVTNVEHEQNLNEAKRYIRILDPKYITQVVNEFDAMIKA